MRERQGAGGAWATSGKLRVGQDLGVNLQAKFEELNYYTIQFNLLIAAGKDPDQLVKPLAEINWITKGVKVRRLVSIVNGLAVSGNAETCNLKMYDWGALSLGSYEYDVSAQITKGGSRAVNTNLPPQLYTNSTNSPDDPLPRNNLSSSILLASGGGVYRHLVPPDCGIQSTWFSARAQAAGNVPTGTDLTIQQVSGPGGVLLQAYDANSKDLWIPLASNATEVRYLNNSAFNIIITPIWGIEG